MKIKLKKVCYEDLPKDKPKVRKPKKPNIFFRTLMKVVGAFDLRSAKFNCEKIGMDRLGKKEPCLILMNHSSFIDLEIASSVFYPRPLNIVATFDAYIGKNWLMRQLGCIETKKFTVGVQLLKDMSYVLKKLKSSILMFPEAGYSLDGRAAILPDSLGKCLKHFGVPIVSVITYGAFHRQPLYNNLRKRNVPVTAKIEYLLSSEEIAEKSAEELNKIVFDKFSFDNFRWQKETGLVISDEDRAEGLERILYKCPNCHTEDSMRGEGKTLTCGKCKKTYLLTELGEMQAVEGETEFTEISKWVDWERSCVKEEIDGGRYALNIPVDVRVMVDTKGVYEIGEGRLTHGAEGFRLVGCDGKLDYRQSVSASYTINSDFYWYQIGDVINIGDLRTQYFCFPKMQTHPVFKTRLAAEELFKQQKEKIKK